MSAFAFFALCAAAGASEHQCRVVTTHPQAELSPCRTGAVTRCSCEQCVAHEQYVECSFVEHGALVAYLEGSGLSCRDARRVLTTAQREDNAAELGHWYDWMHEETTVVS